ncbi:MAG: cyanophycin synthetase [Proteobacteria bacterium]|nr:cyanophycin synthetase [Pseudomonadota bacterium]HQR02603.1 cyanophycin synthetase [Rhodocyclaceae bacterium]
MNRKDIRILAIHSLRGPNIWTYRPALEAWVDIGDLEESPSNTIPGFYERLTGFLPSLIEHKCSPGVRGGFLQRLKEGTWPAHILEHVTIELQNLAGMQTGFGKARSTSRYGVYKVVVRSRNEAVSRSALLAARDLVMAAIEDRPYDVATTVATLTDQVDSLCLGPSTACIVDAATDRSIPSIRLSEGNLVQLGYGIRQRRIWTAETDRTSAIAESISRDKDLTKTLLASCGVPVPEGCEVESPEEAWSAAEDIGLPVVLKPCDGNHGRGVCTNLDTRPSIEAAYAIAAAEGSGVMVERFIRGSEHRLLVVGDRMVAATRGEETWIVGNGKSSIRELIESQVNSDPRRGEEETFPLETLHIEREPAIRMEIERQGFGTEDIVPPGMRVLIQRSGRLTEDITDQVHPDVAGLAVLAARIVGLDIAGVDLVAEDISRPMAPQQAAIVEVNAGPGLLMHLKPEKGEPRPVGTAIVDHLFPAADSGRIPIIGVSGSQDTSTIAGLVAWLLQLSGRHTGLASRQGLYLDRRQVENTDSSHWEPSQRLLINRSVEAAVFEHTARSILAEGLPYDRCEVGIVTGIPAPQGLEDFYIQDADQMRAILRTQIDVVLPTGTAILNAEDPVAAGMAELCDGGVILYAEDGNHSALLTHRQQGGHAVFVEDAQVFRSNKDETGAILKLDGLRTTMPRHALVAAIAAAIALDIGPDLIRAGIETYAPDSSGRPVQGTH